MIILRDKSFSTIEISGYKQVDYKKDPNTVKNGQYIHGEETYIFEKDGQKFIFKTSDKDFNMNLMKAKLGNKQNFEKWARENIIEQLEPIEEL